MSFCVYHKETTRFLRILKNGYWQDAIYERRQDCVAALTRATRKVEAKIADKSPRHREELKSLKERLKSLREDYLIEDLKVFRETIEKTEVKINLMSGKEFTQSVNEPACCDPSTETYWSM